MDVKLLCLLLLLLPGTGWLMGCANIMPPEGGPRDTTAPKLVRVVPADSLLNSRVTKVELQFDEFITLNNPASEITIAPILPFPLNIEAKLRKVVVQIPDSLLMPSTTYRLSFGRAIQDLHEGNPFEGYTYTFSTGGFFDSLLLSGYVVDALSGRRDSGVLVVLYDAAGSDSAVVRAKPLYATKTGPGGNFRFSGLPAREFRIYAMKDDNNNMVFDGPPEMIAFADTTVHPSDTSLRPVGLYIFLPVDTGKLEDPVAREDRGGRMGRGSRTSEAKSFSYVVKVDTSDIRKRTKEVTEPLEVVFNRPVDSFSIERVSLSYDSAGTAVDVSVRRIEDTTKPESILLKTDWREDMVYTLRLLKGFARDSAGTEVMPSRFSFRTKRDDDYSKLQVNLPSEYGEGGYLFLLQKDKDTIHHAPITDTVVRFSKMRPGGYQMRVIRDRNGNGRWDTGDLFGKVQPEEVIPFNEPMNLRAGWEHIVDFRKRGNPAPRTGAGGPGAAR